MKPIISIIVPIYNVEKYLPKCIESILNQNFKEFELILINDGSTDNSGKICDLYAEKDNRIKIIHKKNGGVSSARNSGLNAVSGEYIGFVDPDDYIDKDMYRNLYELCKSNNCDIGICRLGREIDGELLNNNKEEKIIKLDKIQSMKELFKGNLYRFSLCNKIYKRNCFENVIFPEGHIHEDLSTTYKLFANSNKAIYTSYEGYIYVKRENSILTSTYSEKRLQAFSGWDEIIEFISKNYNEVLDEAIATFTYWCMDNVFYILNQIDDYNCIKKYLKYIQKYTNKYYFYIKHNKFLSKSYKKKVILLNLNINILIFRNKIRRILSD